ncbi:hypothetical protein BDZ89DRAFT_1062489 [Hymenopellis radicata]|nr:hypothetical protein BDZ89DRAFT_1062489 [Hymenopellis radicata]
MSDYVPCIDDLRVKLCYICRDEERYDQPENPPRVWIHPCRCALIAHEACLLDWIQSSQGRSEVAAQNATIVGPPSLVSHESCKSNLLTLTEDLRARCL